MFVKRHSVPLVPSFFMSKRGRVSRCQSHFGLSLSRLISLATASSTAQTPVMPAVTAQKYVDPIPQECAA